MSRVLLIDDDRALCRSLQLALGQEGHEVLSAQDAATGMEMAADSQPDLVLLDLQLPDQDGLSTLSRLQETVPAIPVAIVTGRQEMRTAIEAMRAGAFDYLRKPFELEEVLLLLEKAARAACPRLAETLPEEEEPPSPFEIVGSDRRILEVVKTIGLLSRSRVNVLVEGESGTGKEMVARVLHEATCPGRPFVAVNCSAVVGTLFESELFGHERGAFTGAESRKTGKMEHASDGTLFLDEVGDLPPELQPKLLRVLQEREYERVGGLQALPFRARVVAATNVDLEGRVRDGRFREDLFYRLAVSRIHLPPLRERSGDIPLLARHLLGRISLRLHRPVSGLDESALLKLQAYPWPGNIRELENVLTRAVALARGDRLTSDDLDCPVGLPAPCLPATPSHSGIRPLEEAVRAHVEEALRATRWNITLAARMLDISPTTLRKKISDYGIQRPTQE